MACHTVFLPLCAVIAGLFIRYAYSGYCTGTDICEATCYESVRGYRRCGLFGLFRCTTFRQKAYSCNQTCTTQVCCHGYTGSDCETDIQPPMMTGCSDDVYVNATDHTVHYNWTEPIFTDPMGSDLDIVSNYNSPEYIFPWGDFTVQYVATKISNGLVTECAFQVKVRPTPCEDLNVPTNGARLCNGWKTDYGRFCMIMCQQNYTLGPPHSYFTWHVCGASGSWIAASPVPNCEIQVESNNEAEYFQPEYSGYVFSSSCENNVTRDALQNLYIDYLKGQDGFSSYCSAYEDECIKENVDVKCS